VWTPLPCKKVWKYGVSMSGCKDVLTPILPYALTPILLKGRGWLYEIPSFFGCCPEEASFSALPFWMSVCCVGIWLCSGQSSITQQDLYWSLPAKVLLYNIFCMHMELRTGSSFGGPQAMLWVSIHNCRV